MKEGWADDTYVIAFDDDEALHVTSLYGIENYLPGHIVVAIVGWDEFIVRNKTGGLLRVPTIPLVQNYVEKLPSMPDTSRLIASPEHTGRIKWYVKPLIFGGDPGDASNIEWVDMQSHQKLVQFWNNRYLQARQ